MLARAATAEQTLADLAGLKTGALAIAASQTVGSYWLPPRIAAFHARYPGVAVALRIGNTDAVAEMTRAGDVDLGFVEGEIDDPTLDATPIDEDELLIVAAGGAHALLKGLDADGLAAATWVAREKGSGTRAAFESALAAFGVDIARRHIAFELPSNEAICAAVAAGAGLAVMSRLVVDAAIKAGELAAAPLSLAAAALPRAAPSATLRIAGGARLLQHADQRRLIDARRRVNYARMRSLQIIAANSAAPISTAIEPTIVGASGPFISVK